MHADVERAFAFMARGDIAGSRREPFALGTAVSDERLPGRWDSNYLLVERGCTPEELLEAWERTRHPNGGRFRLLLIPDERIGEPLARALTPGGWSADRHLVMVLRRPPDRPSSGDGVLEVGHERLQPLRTRLILEQPWGSPETAAVLLDAKPAIGERVTARFFAAVEDGEVVSCADLYLEGKEAQIEDVATTPERRNRGYARTVVSRAIAEARRAGAEFVFLVADDEDWPKALYRKLGFDPVGRYVKLRAP